MIRLQELTGMRPGEVVIMRMADVDITGKVWVYTPTQQRTKDLGKDCFIAIGPKGQATLRCLFKLDREAFLFDPRASDVEHRDVKVAPGSRRSRRPGANATGRRWSSRSVCSATATP